jgi:mannose-6-phosphate isomerase-like protein (cupin superfamily)
MYKFNRPRRDRYTEDSYYQDHHRQNDYGPYPYAVNIEEETLHNKFFRSALWTGNHLQLTLMCINPGEEIGLEIHPDTDQFLRLEQGRGVVVMGERRERLDFRKNVHENYAIFVPAGTWHNLINTGREPIKLYSIYAPPAHPHGTIHKTREEAEEQEHSNPYELHERPERRGY